MNHIQREFGLLPSKVKKENKIEYIQSLSEAREAGDSSIFEDFMFREHFRNIREEIESFRASINADNIRVGGITQ